MYVRVTVRQVRVRADVDFALMRRCADLRFFMWPVGLVAISQKQVISNGAKAKTKAPAIKIWGASLAS